MIANNGHEWKTLDDTIMLGTRKIVAVYVGDKRVYPDDAIDYAFWHSFPPQMVHISSPGVVGPVNQQGGKVIFNGTITKAAVCARIFDNKLYVRYAIKGYFAGTPTLDHFLALYGDVLYTPNNSSMASYTFNSVSGGFMEVSGNDDMGILYNVQTTDGSAYVSYDNINIYSYRMKMFINLNAYLNYMSS